MTTGIEAFNVYLDDLNNTDNTDKEAYLNNIFNKIKNIKEVAKTNLGLEWNTSVKKLAITPETTLQSTDENKFDHAFQKILVELKKDNDYYIKFLKTITLQNKSVQPMTIKEYQKRITSFFGMIIEGVKNNGFFVCQEDDYIRLYDYLMDITDGKNIANLLTTNRVGYIHATKLGLDDNGIKGATSSTKDMFKDAIVGGEAIYDELIKNGADNKNLGDGVTIYYNNAIWSCETAKCSSGVNYDSNEYIISLPNLDKVNLSIKDAKDPFIIAKFQKKNTEVKIIIATTHLASGETTIKCTEKGTDCKRKELIINLLASINDMNSEKVPVIIGMDGNSSAYTDHTGVVDLLTGYTSAISGHTLSDKYNNSNIIISSIKERGMVTNQPFKTEPIKNLIDYLVYSGNGLDLTKQAVLPKDTNNTVLVKEYGLPSNFTEYKLPPTGKWGEMDQWFNWGSDHLPVRATFELNETKFDVTTLNALALTLTKDGFIQGSEWPLETRIVKKYGKLLDTEQAIKIIAIGEKINVEANTRFDVIQNMVEPTGVKLEMVEPPSVKSLESTLDKLIYKLFEKSIKTRAADVITDMENNPYKYVGDSIRFSLKIPAEAEPTKYEYVKNFITQFIYKNKAYTNSNPVHDVTNGGINVKFIDKHSTFRWEIQFLTDAAEKVYKNPENHDLYKDMQRFLANLRYTNLSRGNIESLKTEYAKNFHERVKNRIATSSAEQSDTPDKLGTVEFAKTKDTIIEMNEVITDLFIPRYMQSTEASVSRNNDNTSLRQKTYKGLPWRGGRKTSKNKKGGKHTRKRNKNNKMTKTKTKKRNKPKPKSDLNIPIM